jgi:GNAT superfamily N-acetyltransferase
MLFKVSNCFARCIEPNDGYALQALCEQCTDYYEFVFGLPPGPAEAQSLFTALPEGKDYTDKQLIGFYEEGQGQLIGFLDVIRDYSNIGDWTIGLMLLSPQWRGQGLGEKLYHAFSQWAQASGAKQIRLGVVEHNKRAYRFWQRMGFETIERRSPSQMGNKEGVLIVMRRCY